MENASFLDLAHWRRLISELYADVRRISETDPARAREEFRARRDAMFSSHPQSPLDPAQRTGFRGLDWFPYDPRMRFRAIVTPIDHASRGPSTLLELSEGRSGHRPFASVEITSLEGQTGSSRLTLYWIEGYGGGLFLPFRDGTNGSETYGGGRYLYDTIKGADLGAGPGEILLDFNFAYNPSCAYNARWVCPLSPPGNTLPFRVEAGELAFQTHAVT